MMPFSPAAAPARDEPRSDTAMLAVDFLILFYAAALATRHA